MKFTQKIKVSEPNPNLVQAEDTHVDTWLDQPSFPPNEKENYAKFVLEYTRLPAWKQMAFAPWMKQFKLFCTYMGKRYRVTGASRGIGSLAGNWLRSATAERPRRA